MYWEGWFKGLSKMFLSSRIPKLLLLAGIDRLDKELTIAQMQGMTISSVIENAKYNSNIAQGSFR